MSTVAEPVKASRSYKAPAIKTAVLLARANGKPWTHIAKEFGVAVNTAKAIVKQAALDDVQPEKGIIAALEAEGITFSRVARKLSDKMDAKETRFFHYKGRVVEQADVEEHRTQLDALELVMRAYGLLNDDKGPTNIGTVNILWGGDAPAWAKPGLHNGSNRTQACVENKELSSNVCIIDNGPVLTDGQAEQVENCSEGKAPGISPMEGTGSGPGGTPPIHSTQNSEVEPG